MDDERWEQIVSAMRRGPPPRESRDGRPIVLFRTPWERLDDGWSIAARSYARAMEAANTDVRLVSWKAPEETLDPDVMIEAGRFARPPREWDLHIYSCILGSAKDMVPRFMNLRCNPGPQAYHCVFERGNIEPQLVAALNNLDGVWSQCSANFEVLKKSGVKNVTLLYYPYFDDDPHLDLPPPKESRRFYWIGRNEPRKAPDNLIRAFMRAFKPGEAELTLKLSMYRHPGAYPNLESSILDVLQEGVDGWTVTNWRESVHLVQGRLTTDEMVELHAKNDVYVSASRGEGLDLPAFAAKLAGRQLVLTDSGGPRDFVNDGDILVPATGRVSADEAYPWGEGAVYNDYALDDLIAAMQRARGSRPVGSRVDDRFHVSNVAPTFRNWIKSLTT